MKVLVWITVCIFSSLTAAAQTGTSDWTVQNAEKRQTINLSDKNPDWFLAIAYNVHLPMSPKKLSVLKDSVYRNIQRPQGIKEQRREEEIPVILPKVMVGFDGGESFALPNDDYIAVSKDGKIVATQNNLISVFDENGNLLAQKSLRVFSGSSSLERNFDPRIIYDESADRFILVYLKGNTYETSKVELAFSGTSNPTGVWYHYSFSGNPFNDSTWCDYPGIALCGPHLFLTFNTFKNGSVSNSAFKQSVIWQLEKQKGYNNVPAGELGVNILQNIKYNDTILFGLYPVNGSPDTSMYFLSNYALSSVPNNKILLLKLDPQIQLSSPEIRLISCSIPYQLPPDALQKNTDRKLNTNDARIQDSFYADKSISFVLNSAKSIFGNLSPGIYFGRLHDISGNQLTGEYLPDSLEIAFASIVPVRDEGVLFCYSSSSALGFPGISVIYRDKHGSYSNPVRVIAGSDYVMFWGDYNKICRHPSYSDVYWLAGCYGLEDGTISNGELATHIARVELNWQSGSPVFPSPERRVKLHPNPSLNNRITATFNLQQSEIIEIGIYNILGSRIATIMNDKMPSGTHRVSFSTASLASGIYILTGKTLAEVVFSEKFIIE